MKILKRITGLLSSAFTLLGSVGVHIAPAVKVVNCLKAVVNNPALDILTGLTKNDWDEKLLRQIRTAVDDVVQGLNVPEVTTGKGSVFSKQVADLTAFIREQPDNHRSAIYAKSASLIASRLSGGKLSEAEADTLVQLAYVQQKAESAA
jgi:hypothetical protein